MRAHICIGGPLDGEFATNADFYGAYEKVPGTKRNDYSKPIEGMYAHLKHDYFDYNNATRGRLANVVWIHKSLLPPSIPASKR